MGLAGVLAGLQLHQKTSDLGRLLPVAYAAAHSFQIARLNASLRAFGTSEHPESRQPAAPEHADMVSGAVPGGPSPLVKLPAIKLPFAMGPAIAQSGSSPVSLLAGGRSFHSSATCSAKRDGGASSSDEEKWKSDEELVLGLDEDEFEGEDEEWMDDEEVEFDEDDEEFEAKLERRRVNEDLDDFDEDDYDEEEEEADKAKLKKV